MAKNGEEHIPRFFRYDLSIRKKLIKRWVVSESGAKIKATTLYYFWWGLIHYMSYYFTYQMMFSFPFT